MCFTVGLLEEVVSQVSAWLSSIGPHGRQSLPGFVSLCSWWTKSPDFNSGALWGQGRLSVQMVWRLCEGDRLGGSPDGMPAS